MEHDQISSSSSSCVGGAVEDEDPFVSPRLSGPGPAIVDGPSDTGSEQHVHNRHGADVAHNNPVHGTNQFLPSNSHMTYGAYGAQQSASFIPPPGRFTSAIPTTQPITWAHQGPANLYPPSHNSFSQYPTPFTVLPPMAAMDSVVAFDPSSDPPFIDRTRLFFPRAHGVIRIKNVSEQLPHHTDSSSRWRSTACVTFCGENG